MKWNFDYLNTLQCTPLSHGRVFSTPRGSGPLLLFVHGGFHGAWCWSLFLKYMAERKVPAAAVDLRGHGGLTPPDGFLDMGVSHMTIDVIEAAHVLGGPVVLAGHSLGALVSAVAAEQIKPTGLMLLAPSPPANVPGIHLLPAFPTDKPIAVPPEERTRKWFLPGYSGTDISAYQARMTPESPAFINDRYRGRVPADPTWVNGPTLCVSAGKDDSALHPAGQDEAIAAFYGAEFALIPEAGHCFMADDSWEAGAALILDWLKRKNLAGNF